MTAAHLFYVFAGMSVLAALSVVFMKNPVSSAFSLVMVFFGFAAQYALLGAHLIAAFQILVYTGAVMVLFIFVIMLLNAGVPSPDLSHSHWIFRAFLGACGLGLMGVFVWIFRESSFNPVIGPFTVESIEAHGGNTRVLSEVIFSDWLFPFELTSVLLLSAVVGVVAIAMRKKPETSRKRGLVK